MTMLINKKFMDDLTAQARNSPRLRSHFNLHASHEELVQRIYIGAQPGTYIRPHAHMQKHKWEYISIVRGAMDFLQFTAGGVLEQRLSLRAGDDTSAIEFPAGTWHSLIIGQPDTVFFEVKQGPFDAASNAAFAEWAPEENTPGVARFLQAMTQLTVGTALTI